MLQGWAGCSLEHQGFPKLPETHPSWEEKGCGHALAQAGVFGQGRFGQGVVVSHGALALVLLQLLQPFAAALVCCTPLSPTIQNRGDTIVIILPSLLPSGAALVGQTPGQGAKDSVPALGDTGSTVAAASSLHPARGTDLTTIFCPLSSKLTWTKPEAIVATATQSPQPM